jgi:hypothetical protein
MAARSTTSARAFGTHPIVVAYGMGVDSTAMLIGLRDRGIPVSLILFADAGSEKRETMAYLPIIQTWLARNGFPPVTVIKRHSPRAGETSLHAECLRKNVLPSLAYGGHPCSLKKMEGRSAVAFHATLLWLGRPPADMAAWTFRHQADRL